MLLLQTILIMLKLMPVFYYEHPLQGYITYFHQVNWWIIFIPTFISIANGMWHYFILKSIAEESEM